MSDRAEGSARSVREETAGGSSSVRDVAERTLEAVASRAELGAFGSVDVDDVRSRADALDAALARGEEPGPLFGVPIAWKANLCVAGSETNCGSRLLEGYRPPYSATVIERLERAGALLVGPTQMDEFAMGSSGENCAFGPARNPWDPERIPGGSSSGSAVAVSASVVPAALGSDTGGSVRQPAALCGLSGFKPTYGRVSRYGLVAFGSSLDQISPLARDVRDLELVLATISGADERDSTCSELPAVEPAPALDPRGLRVGVPEDVLGAGIAPEVRAAFESALADLEALGATRVPVELPHAEHAVATYYVVATAEASSNLARYDGIRFGRREAGDGTLAGMMAATREAGFGDEVKRRILLGTHVLSSGYYDAWYGRAQRVRRLILADYERAFERCDLVATPTSPTVAFRLGERASDPVAMYRSDVLTVPASLAGLPALSLPAGLAEADDAAAPLPVGLQLVGPARADAEVLAAGRVFQDATDHHRAVPPLVATEVPR